jgi:hypothetical protein
MQGSDCSGGITRSSASVTSSWAASTSPVSNMISALSARAYEAQGVGLLDAPQLCREGNPIDPSRLRWLGALP